MVWVLKDPDFRTLTSAELLSLLRDLECSKPEDRVYSILRFLPPTLAQNLALVKRQSTEALFTDLATVEITQNRYMDFLAAAGMCQHRRWYSLRRDEQLRPILQLPTWVPDWTCWIITPGLWTMNNGSISAGYKWGTGYRPSYQAVGNSRGDARLVNLGDTKVLCVQGKIFDDIAVCVEPFDFPVISRSHRDDEIFLQPVPDMTKAQVMEHSTQVTKFFDDFENNTTIKHVSSSIEQLKLQVDSFMALAKSCKMYADDIGRTTAYHQTLIGGMITHTSQLIGGGLHVKATDEEANELFTEWDSLLEFNKLMKRSSEVLGKLLSFQGPNLNEEDMLVVSRGQEIMEKRKTVKWRDGYAIQAMGLACNGRRFFTTTKGFMGLAPDIAQVGDKICLISGCCTPFVIRPDGPNFCLVGESYVHGVMDGELMSDITFEDINLV